MYRIAVAGLLLVTFGGAFTALAAINEPVRLDSGLVTGVPAQATDTRVFKGIPFAAPPLGDLRWRPPQPVEHWEGVRKADEMSPVCMQNTAGQATKPSEDCLYLNVWTAAQSASEKRPVMVWIYGGGFTSGSGSQPDYDGENLAQKGVIVVTFNYRLGAFGFFAHPELTKESDRRGAANFGMLDALAALQWVQKNISAFGGDPKRVTVFGESAGAIMIADLMASPLARGLFHHAIAESGSWSINVTAGRMTTLAEAEQAGVKLAQILEAKSLEDLRAHPAQEILTSIRGTGPVVDGWVLTDDPGTIFSTGKQMEVPLLLGSNQDEGTFFLEPVKADAFRAEARTRFGDLTDEFLKLYPAGSDEEASASQLRDFRDQMAWVMRNWARLDSMTGKSRTYLYYFTHQPPGPTASKNGRARGATHTAEIPYVFQNPRSRQWDDGDRKISDLMSSYWINFAATGDPNGKGLPNWPAWDPRRSGNPMVFGEKAQVGPALPPAQIEFYQRVYDRRRQSSH